MLRKYPKIKTAIFDIETNGLLQESDFYKWDSRFGQKRPPLDTIHVLVIRDYERNINYVFRHNSEQDNIEDGLELLEEADLLVGHNILHFDMPAFSQVYTGVCFNGAVYDTLPMIRMVRANQKDLDFRLFERGLIKGEYIGRHTLEAWGFRLGVLKGTYEDWAEEQKIDPWGAWNQEMEDYCVQDVAVSVRLYEYAKAQNWDFNAIKLEHEIHDLMGQQERNGIYFNVEAARKLEAELRQEADKYQYELINHFGKWYMPFKKYIVKPLWDDPEGINKAKKYPLPREEFGEDFSRAVWAEVTVPKRDVTYQEILRGSYSKDAPYCKIELKEFNPGSRIQIIDRLSTIYNWHPVDFTDKGNPEVNDEVLRRLIDVIPMTKQLAELFYYQKTLGQLVDGANGWLRLVDSRNLIHGYVNTGGTISGRASHTGPNLAQVKKVKYIKAKDADGNYILKPDGKNKMVIGYGRDGDHGWECRSLFYAPPPWVMVGADLKGIELRCFGEALVKYDGGAYLNLVLSGDPHEYNRQLAGLPTRDNAKTFIYALIYGAGDVKLGSIVAPLADEEEQRAIGKKLRARFMEGLPAFAKLNAEIQKQARRGFLPGLDGRKLFVRSKHSALNTKLQSDAALIAKKWVCLSEDIVTNPEPYFSQIVNAEKYVNDLEQSLTKLGKGLTHGWNYDFVQLLWIHDEIQTATLIDPVALGKVLEFAAVLSGRYFNYSCPVEAEAKHGANWALTH